MNREFQIRTEDLNTGDEAIECFSDETSAKQAYLDRLETHTRTDGNIAFELIEVLEQHTLKG